MCMCFVCSKKRSSVSLLCELDSYKETHDAVAKAAIRSFSGHLCYVSEILVGLAFLDSEVSAEIKSAMVAAIDVKTTDHPRHIALTTTLHQKQQLLSDFAS